MGNDDKKPEVEDAALERHVDEIMDPKLSNTTAAGQSGLRGAPDLPAIDIFADADATAAAVGAAGEDSEQGGRTPDEHDAVSASEDSKTVDADETSTAEKAAHVSEEKIASDPAIEKIADDPVVDDIVSSEGNELLAARDAEIARAFDPHQPSFSERFKNFVSAWWDNKLLRYGSVLVLLGFVGAVASVPASRNYVLNTAGVRASASLTILDHTTGLPLKNVAVTLGAQNGRTDKNGVAHLAGVRLGAEPLTIRQLGFAPIRKTVTLGLGANTLGELDLTAIGTQYRFQVTDYLSGKPLTDVLATSGDANAKADSQGRIVLTVGQLDGNSLQVEFSGDTYRTENLTIDNTKTAVTPLSMVSNRKVVFVSKQSGHYDVYKTDLDGKNKQLLLTGTGLERDRISLVSNADSSKVALVSSREDKRDGDGYLMDTLTLIDIATGSTLSLDHSEQIQMVDWSSDWLVYVKIKAGTSAGNSERYQLVSYDPLNTNRQILAAANNFNDIVTARGSIYYATSNNWYPGGQSQFVRVYPDNTGKQILLSADVWNILRNSYNQLDLNGQQKWYGYHLGDVSAKDAVQPPANTVDSRFYLDAPDGKRALWTDSRDGKGVLLAYDSATGKDTIIATQSGLGVPLQWLDDHTAIYRVVTSSETAAYAVSLDGGPARKVTDVTNASGLGQWHY